VVDPQTLPAVADLETGTAPSFVLGILILGRNCFTSTMVHKSHVVATIVSYILHTATRQEVLR
jgi:hypothetical protein